VWSPEPIIVAVAWARVGGGRIEQRVLLAFGGAGSRQIAIVHRPRMSATHGWPIGSSVHFG
jgi:hypothetical protein